ncbi:MAG: agmatine deiminase family protein [Rhodanobacteraceae bacterium]
MSAGRFRLPAEWQPQAAIVVAWPHEHTDWASRLAEVESSYTALIGAIARFESVIICVASATLEQRAAHRLDAAGIDRARLRFVEVAYDDTWLRDSGPITLTDGTHFRVCDFRFTGWGGKFPADHDDALVGGLVRQGVFRNAEHQRIDWSLEGGAIESDGAGTLLTTWRCLSQRHPGQPRKHLAQRLEQSLGAERVMWLDHGYLEGDDTDAHIDTLARFAPDDAIVYQACDDTADNHHAELAAMRDELARLHTRDGRPYRLHPLPWPRPIVDNQRRLAASYANYLIVNGGVLVPAYGDEADVAAQRVIASAHPGREIVPVPCRSLIWQNGSLHCLTMQLPAGLVAPSESDDEA